MRIHLSSHLGFFVPGHPAWVDTPLDTSTPLGAVLNRLGIPAGEVSLAVVNGEAVDVNKVVVKEGDEVRLYPPVGGG